MRREARNNLIFIIVLLILVTPGLVMLVRKKLRQPPSDQMGFSSPVRLAIPYIDPLPKSTQYRLINPPVLHQWVQGLAANRWTQQPTVSRQRSFQLIDFSGDQAVILIWDPRLKISSATFFIDGKPVAPAQVDSLSLPPAVISELRQLGYLAPPTEIAKVVFTLPPTPSPATRFSVEATGEPFSDELIVSPDAP